MNREDHFECRQVEEGLREELAETGTKVAELESQVDRLQEQLEAARSLAGQIRDLARDIEQGS